MIVFLVSAGLVIFARLRGWQSYDHPEPADESSDASPRGNESFIYRHRWGILLSVTIFAVLLFAVVFAPPRLTGEIPPTPNQPGRPFYSLHWTRDFIRENQQAVANWSNFLASLLCLVPIVIAIKRHSRIHTEVALLFSSLTLAMLAQWILADDELVKVGVVLYAFSILGFSYWAWLARPRIMANLSPATIKTTWEMPVVFLLLLLTIF